MLKFIQNNREITALLAVVLLFVLPGFLDRQYLSVQTLTMVYSSAQILILLAMGATLVMLTRNIDVSVGSITGMCAVLLGIERIVAGCPVPIVIAGGKKLPEREALEMCWQAIDQGASGVDMGRNIFQSDHPVAMMKAVQAVVHHNETADRAYELYLSEKQ
ncbi:hypothetical protein D6Z18_14470 [Escherichia coli]|nr:hypothetical protein [Escherichia coli]